MFAQTLTRRVLAFADQHRAGFEPFYTEIPGLSVVRQFQPTDITPVLYQPVFCLVLQGAKQTSLGEGLITFSEGRSVIVGLELPTFARACEATRERPYVAVALQIDMTLIKELAAEIDGFMGERTQAIDRKRHVAAVAEGEADDAIVNAMERLFGLIGKPTAAAILRPLLMREIHFWLLSASHGGLLRQLAKANSHAARISEAIIHIPRNFTVPLRIPDLARAVGMSESAFHEHFKAMCGTTPLQFQKRVRLMEARRLLISENRSVSSASAAVGYESPTKFSREFTRMFGSPPASIVIPLHTVRAPARAQQYHTTLSRTISRRNPIQVATQVVAIVIHEGVQALDVAGPIDVFTEANNFLGSGHRYETVLVATVRDPIRASNGMRLLADLSLEEATGGFDVILVAGGPALPEAAPDLGLIGWLQQAPWLASTYGSICTGAFVLGHAGLLDDRRVTTHWQNAHALSAKFPKAKVESDLIYVRDGRLITSAGVTAGIDLALALVGQRHGAEVALKVAKRLVVVAQRQGGQSQFSPYLSAPADPASPIARVQDHVMANIGSRHTLESLAAAARMSTRNFARHFVQETGITPHEFIERARVDAARMMLEGSDLALKAVAYDCGFGSADRMRIVFTARLGVTPAQYRASFRAAESI